MSCLHENAVPLPYAPPGPQQQLMGPAMGPPFMGLATVVQHTSVNINRQMPQDYFIWSVLNFLYCNPFCLGLAALIQSVKSRDRKVMGDVESSRSYSSTARQFNIAATAMGSYIGLIIFIVLVTR